MRNYNRKQTCSSFSNKYSYPIVKTTLKKEPTISSLTYNGFQHSREAIPLIARIRELQDDLTSQRLKNQMLQSKFQEIQAQFLHLESQLNAFQHNQVYAKKKDFQIQQYEQNIHNIEKEIATLNECLIKKNHQYTELIKQSINYQVLVKSLREENSRLNQLNRTHETKIHSILASLQAQKQLSSELSFPHDVQLLGKIAMKMKEDRKKLMNTIEKLKKDYNEKIIIQKEKYLKLQYQIKLIKDRGSDNHKRSCLEELHSKNSKFEQIIQDMLKKQDELTYKIEKLQTQNDQLKQQYEEELMTRQRNFNEQKKELQRQIQRLQSYCQRIKHQQTHSKQMQRSLSSKLERVLQQTDRQTSRQFDSDIQMMRRLRLSEQQNKMLQIRIQEIHRQNSLMKKQILILKQ